MCKLTHCSSIPHYMNIFLLESFMYLIRAREGTYNEYNKDSVYLTLLPLRVVGFGNH